MNSINLEDKNSRVREKHVRPKWDREALAAKYGISPEQLPDKSNNNPKKKEQSTAPGSSQQKANTKKAPQDTEEAAPPIGMSEGAQKAWKALGSTPKHFQQLMEELHMSSSELSRCITELELYAAVKAHPGNLYSRG